jgi:hypothetical protein
MVRAVLERGAVMGAIVTPRYTNAWLVLEPWRAARLLLFFAGVDMDLNMRFWGCSRKL